MSPGSCMKGVGKVRITCLVAFSVVSFPRSGGMWAKGSKFSALCSLQFALPGGRRQCCPGAESFLQHPGRGGEGAGWCIDVWCCSSSDLIQHNGTWPVSVKAEPRCCGVVLVWAVCRIPSCARLHQARGILPMLSNVCSNSV